MPDPTRQTVSSTEVAALYGLSPWVTEYMLYQRFANGVDIDPPEHERMRLGKLLQPVIVQLVADELRLDVTPIAESVYRLRGSLGASFDAEIWCPTRGRGVVETKNIDWLRWRQNYVFDENDQCVAAPAHYEIQMHVQMHVLDVDWGVHATLVGGNELCLLERVRDYEMGERLEERAASFLERVRGRNEPDVVGAEDLDLVQRLVPDLSPEPPLDLRGAVDGLEAAELAIAYEDFRETRLADAKHEEAAKARLLHMVSGLGDPAPGVVLTDEGTLTVKRGKDTLYRNPEAVRRLLELMPSNLDDDEELSAAVGAVRDLEKNVARKGGVRVRWKENSDG